MRSGGEVNMRAVNIGDNASDIGAHVKGRSSVRHINSRCRRSCALQLGFNLRVFMIYETSKKNPADRPSRVEALIEISFLRFAI